MRRFCEKKGRFKSLAEFILDFGVSRKSDRAPRSSKKGTFDVPAMIVPLSSLRDVVRKVVSIGIPFPMLAS